MNRNRQPSIWIRGETICSMQTRFLFNMQSRELQSAGIWHSTFTKGLEAYIKKKKQGEGGRRRWDLQDAMFKKAVCGVQYSLRERRIKIGKEGLDLCTFVLISFFQWGSPCIWQITCVSILELPIYPHYTHSGHVVNDRQVPSTFTSVSALFTTM